MNNIKNGTNIVREDTIEHCDMGYKHYERWYEQCEMGYEQCEMRY